MRRPLSEAEADVRAASIVAAASVKRDGRWDGTDDSSFARLESGADVAQPSGYAGTPGMQYASPYDQASRPSQGDIVMPSVQQQPQQPSQQQYSGDSGTQRSMSTGYPAMAEQAPSTASQQQQQQQQRQPTIAGEGAPDPRVLQQLQALAAQLRSQQLSETSSLTPSSYGDSNSTGAQVAQPAE